MTGQLRIAMPQDEIEAFCRRWEVAEPALFGSVLRDDFGPDSDVDVLITFPPDADWSLLDVVEMQEELGRIFGHPVDLVEKTWLCNPFRRYSILTSKQVIYAA